MARKYTDRDLIRIALQYADEHLASLIDAHSPPGAYQEHVDRWTRLRAEMDALYERKFSPKAADPLDDVPLRSIFDVGR